MIFGFNTDVRFGETLFHVQSEPRYSERLLQTQVFVGGRCIGKRSTSYASRMSEPGFFEEHLQEMLKGQHRIVVDAAREGRLSDVLRESEKPASPVALQWLNQASVYSGGAVQMQLQVTRGGNAVAGVSVASRITCNGSRPSFAQGISDSHGRVVLKITASEDHLAGSSVLVQANCDGKRVTRKFNLRRA